MSRISYIFVLIIVCWALALPGSASAHASLAESTPAANSIMLEAPATARLRFTEPLESQYSRVVLAGADGPIATTPSRVAPDDPYALLLDLPTLPEGQYTLQWRTLSTVDGHTMQGVVPFAIGDPAAANAPLVLPPPAPDPLAAPPLADTLLRWFTVLGLALVIDSLIFGAYVWQPVINDRPANSVYDRSTRRLEIAAAALAVIGALGMIVTTSRASDSNMLAFIGGSRVGLMLALRALLALALLAVVSTTTTYRRIVALGLGFLALVSVSLLSHSAVPQTQSSAGLTGVLTALAITFDLLHLLATAAWIGGLPPLLLALLALRSTASGERGRLITMLVARYTEITTASVITLGATGTYAALQHIGAFNELWTTTYGRVLSFKLSLFGLLLLMGGYNRWWVHPRLIRSTSETTESGATPTHITHLRWSVAAEIGASVLLLLAVGALTASVPAREAARRGLGFAETARLDQARLTLQIVRSTTVGDIYAVDVAGLPDSVQPEVLLRVSMPAHGMGEQELALREIEPGRWGERGSLMAMQGVYDAEVIARASGMNDVRHTFAVDTATLSGTTAPRSAIPLWAFLLIGALLLMALSQLSIPYVSRAALRTSGLIVVAGALIATIVPTFFNGTSATENPLVESPAVLAAGNTVYQKNCVSCHGVTGRGDGPAAAALPGLPADFTAPHFATHTDAELYQWIKGGKPGTVMPAFSEQLSDEQIWQTITLIRKMYKDAQQASIR